MNNKIKKIICIIVTVVVVLGTIVLVKDAKNKKEAEEQALTTTEQTTIPPITNEEGQVLTCKVCGSQYCEFEDHCDCVVCANKIIKVHVNFKDNKLKSWKIIETETGLEKSSKAYNDELESNLLNALYEYQGIEDTLFSVKINGENGVYLCEYDKMVEVVKAYIEY